MEQSGTIVFPLPAGEHRVVLELQPTAVRFFSLLASALTGVLLVFGATAVRGAVFRPKAAALALALGAAVLVAAFVARGRIVWGADAPSIMAAASEEATMKAGLDLLYEGRNPGAAEPFFRRVLERNPAHYGATYQLAVALDRTGKADEARRLWEAVLRMADGYKDSQTAATARARLAAPR
jgi:tetratricopeptide (TPR) repeat protein